MSKTEWDMCLTSVKETPVVKLIRLDRDKSPKL